MEILDDFPARKPKSKSLLGLLGSKYGSTIEVGKEPATMPELPSVILPAVFIVLLVVVFAIARLSFGKRTIGGGTAFLVFVFALVFACFGTATFRHYLMGGKEEKKLVKAYQPWLSIWLSEGGADSAVRSTKGAGILVLTMESGTTTIDADRMRQLPADLRASVALGPKIVILYGVRSQRVTIEWGAGARDKYQYQYWFSIVDLTTRRKSGFHEFGWRYEDSSFPEELYKEVLDCAKDLL